MRGVAERVRRSHLAATSSVTLPGSATLRETPLEIRTDGEALILRPVRAPSAAVSASAQRMMDAHADTLARLAR